MGILAVQSYDYANRKGVQALSWEDVAGLAARLTEGIAGVEIVLGIARAGLFPATQAAISLRCELYPVRVSRRVDDVVRFERPVWRVPVPPEVAGKAVAVIDEIADTGETLALVADKARELGAARVITGCLARHSWADPAPDVCPLVSDALVLFPWDQKVYVDGRWQTHPELIEALRLQEKQG